MPEVVDNPLAKLEVKKPNWKVYKSLKNRILEMIAAQYSEMATSDLVASVFFGMKAKDIGGFLFDIQEELVVACTNLTQEQIDELDIDQMGQVFEKVLEKNPIDELVKLEKNSPAGAAIIRLQATLSDLESTGTTADLNPDDLYQPDGGSNTNPS